jgi:hypothetical protein
MAFMLAHAAAVSPILAVYHSLPRARRRVPNTGQTHYHISITMLPLALLILLGSVAARASETHAPLITAAPLLARENIATLGYYTATSNGSIFCK